MDTMLNDSLQLLKENGKLIVLTPTGKGNFLKLTKHSFSIKNSSVYIWYRATKSRARLWTNENYLAEYALKHNLNYKREFVMKGFAQLEIIKGINLRASGIAIGTEPTYRNRPKGRGIKPVSH